jgi:hypothetical protein
MPIQYTDATLGANESLTSFDTPDALAQAYVALDTRVKAGGVDLLGAELSKDPAITPFKSVAELAKSYVETKKMVGGIEKAPGKPEEYKLNPVTGLHANVKAEGIVKALLPIFHGAGVGNTAADKIQQGLLTQLSGMMVQQEAAKKDAILKNETILRSEWGGEFDARMDNMQKIWKNVGGVGNVKESGIENIRALAKLTGFLSEDSLKSLGEEPNAAITDATAAQAEIAKYTAEISSTGGKHDYYLSGPKGDAARKKMNDLFALMQPK